MKSHKKVSTCYRWNHDGRLQFEAVQLSDPTSLSVDSCGQLCLSYGFESSAIEAAKYCSCSNDAPDAVEAAMSECDAQCPGYTTNWIDLHCGSTNDTVLVINVTLSACNLTINANLFAVVIATPITLNVSGCSNYTGINYSFDFGDGTSMTNWFDESMLPIPKTFYAPDSYLIKAYASGPDFQTSASATITVSMPISQVSQLNCPTEADIGQLITCNFTLGLNSNTTMTIGFGDGTNLILSLLDSNYFTAGLAPSFDADTSKAYQSNGTSNYVVFMTQSEFHEGGTLYGFEFSTTDGPANVDLRVVCPNPACNYCFLTNECGNCSTSGTAGNNGSVTCSSSQSYYFEASDSSCYDFTTNSFLPSRYAHTYAYSSYNFSSKPAVTGYQLAVTGNHWIKVTPAGTINVTAGCVIGFQSTYGNIGSRNTLFGEYADVQVNPAGYSSLTPNNVRHFVRAHAYEPQLIMFQKTWTADGLFTVHVNLRNDAESVDLSPVIVQVGQNLVIQCPDTTILNTSITCFVISPNDSTSTYAWNFGDGTTTINSTLRNYSYVYGFPGFYTIEVIRQNVFGYNSTYSTNITVSATTSVAVTTFVTATTSVFVTNCTCCPPVITPLLFSLDFRSPKRYRLYETVFQNVLIDITCDLTLQNYKIWSLAKIDSSDSTIVLQTVTVPVDRNNNSYIVIDPYTLEFGLYAFTFTTGMLLDSVWNSTDEEPLLNASLVGYFEIVPAPIIPVIFQNQSKIILSAGSSVTLNPGVDSIDPNLPPGIAPAFSSFQWTCAKLNALQATNNDADVNTWLMNCDSNGNIRVLSDLSCGYIQLQGNRWTSGFTYELSLTITRTLSVGSYNVNLSGSAKILITITTQQTELAVIQCKKDVCFPINSSLYYNPTDSLLLQASCNGCSDDLPSNIKWTITDQTNNALDIYSYSDGTNTLTLDVWKSFFDQYPADPLSVSFESTSDGITGYGNIVLRTLPSPNLTDCSINATSGQSLVDYFYIMCSWTVDSNIDLYILIAQHQDGTVQKLFSTRILKHTIRLPSGYAQFGYQYKLYVEVMNTYGVAKRQFLSTMTVTICSSIIDQLSTNQMAQYVAESNPIGALIYADSVAAYFNDNPSNAGQFYNDVINSSSPLSLQCSQYYRMNQVCDERSLMALVRSNLLSAVSAFRPMSLTDVSTFSYTLRTIMQTTSDVDLTGQTYANKILANMIDTFENSYMKNLPAADFQAASDLFASTVTFTTTINYGIDFTANRGDQVRCQKLEYENFDSSLPENPDDIVYYEEYTSVEQWQKDAATREQLRIADEIALNIQRADDSISKALLFDATVTSKVLRIDVQNGTVLLQYNRISNLTNSVILSDQVNVDLPADFCQFSTLPNCTGFTPIQNRIIYYTNNLYHYRDTYKVVTTGSIDIEFRRPPNYALISVDNAKIPLMFSFPHNASTEQTVKPQYLAPFQILQLHQINLTKPSSTVQLKFDSPDPLKQQWALYLRCALSKYDNYAGPMQGQYDYSTLATTGDFPFTWTLPSDELIHAGGLFYLGVGQLTDSKDPNGVNIGNINSFLKFPIIPYSISISSPSCHYYAPNNRKWHANGCEVAQGSSSQRTLCQCYHLTIFGGGFFVPPNTIDFNFIFSHADFDQNIHIYVFMFVLLLTYILLLVWGRRKDAEDARKIGCISMPDNDYRDRYIYEIIVTTGADRGSATDSNVNIIISGDYGDTDIRTFGYTLGPKYIFRRGMTNHFALTTRRSLGDLRYIRVWHDNKGKGEFASWFLNDIVILDIQTGRKYPFVSNQWLASEYGDGCIDRILPVASKDELKNFSRLFSQISRRDIADGHIWLSVFARPPGSRFTRVQRLSCCFCFLSLTMLTSAMWYGTYDDSPANYGFRYGPFVVSETEIGVGFMSNLIILPINILLVLAFRKSAPRIKRTNRFYDLFTRIKSQDSNSKSVPAAHIKNRPFLLPWWVRILAWIVLVIVCALSFVLTVCYAIEFGDSKCRKWLTSMLLSFLFSIFIVQPFKVLVSALILSLVCRNTKEETDEDWIQDEDTFLVYDDHSNHSGDTVQASNQRIENVSGDYIKNAQQDRQRQLKMYADLREIFLYVFYICNVVILAYGSRSQIFYLHQQNLKQLFTVARSYDFNFLNDINSVDSYWEWTRKVLAPALRAPHYYNGMPNIGERGFIYDRSNRLLGHAVMRQIRTKPNTCSIPSMIKNISRDCTGDSDLIYEDPRNFDVEWKFLSPRKSRPVLPLEPYTYRTASDLGNIFTPGITDIFGGGGYIVKLIGSLSKLIEKFNSLQKQHWIDRRTRAVLIEFSLFDANANLFSSNKIVAEFPPYGGAITWAVFQPMRLLSSNDAYFSVEIIAQIFFILYALIFLIKETRSLVREGFVAYFGRIWNWIDILLIVSSISAIVSYILRCLKVQEALDNLNQTHGNTILSLQHVLLWDYMYTYGIAFCVFAATFKIALLLRFNRRISLMHITLQCCKRNLLHFFVVFSILFLAFCQVFYLLLQSKLTDFNNFLSAICNIFTIILGKGQYQILFSASPLIPVFFVLFFLTMTVLLINVFVTIILTTFMQVKHDSSKRNNEYEILEYMEFKMRSILGLPASSRQKTFCDNSLMVHGDLAAAEMKMNAVCRKIDVIFGPVPNLPEPAAESVSQKEKSMIKQSF